MVFDVYEKISPPEEDSPKEPIVLILEKFIVYIIGLCTFRFVLTLFLPTCSVFACVLCFVHFDALNVATVLISAAGRYAQSRVIAR